MKCKTSVYTTVITTGTVLTTLPVFAHSGHFEEKSDTTEAPSTEQNTNSSSPSSNTNQSSMENNNQEEIQAVEMQPTTQAQILMIGKIPVLGETIFSLMLVAPFLLYAARKRIHQS